MAVMFLITFLTFFQAFDSRLISFVINLLNKSKQQQLQCDKIADMTAELSKISMTNEWAKYAKLQRKINAERAAYEKSQKEHRTSALKIKGSATVLIKVAIGLSLLIVAWWYRKHTVTSIPEHWVYPLTSYLCWSEDVPGGITVPAWIIMSSAAARAVSSLL